MTPEGDIAVPDARGPWREIWEFALTYNAYERHDGFDGAARIGNETAERWAADRSLPDDVVVARAALFFEQRRFRHFGYDPQGDAADYVRALVGRIHHLTGGSIKEPPDQLA